MKKFGLWTKVKGTKTPKDNSPKPTADTSLLEDISFNPSINIKNDFKLWNDTIIYTKLLII